MIRSFLESATRTWKLKRHLPSAYGKVPVMVTPSGGLKYLVKRMESIDPMLLQFCDKYVQPGNVVWDIGTNVGLFSVAAAVRATASGKVYSFEPDAWLVQLLRQTVSMQPSTSAPMDILPVGVAGACGFMRFALAKRSRSTNFLQGFGTDQTGGIREWTTIYCVTLDWLAENLPLPDVLKIDVEGAEANLLEGAHICFQKKRPTVFIEVAQDTADSVTTFFKKFSYKLFDGDQLGPNLIPVERATANTLAIPF